MKWHIPSKTFLLGEYSAVAEGSAIILTTTPYFELSLIDEERLIEIHPKSPAGTWWFKNHSPRHGLAWHDPYNGCGGLGASSAQFLGCYWATCYLQNKTPDLHTMLEAYYYASWSGKGLRPSGYDVIAQAQHGCVYINKQKKVTHSYNWPFKDLSFLIVHTGVKVATHNHLLETTLPSQIDYLSNLVDETKQAFEEINNIQLINAINNYHQALSSLNLVAHHSLKLIHSLKSHSEILAIKGCGALGADTLLMLTKKTDLDILRKKLISQNWLILASENDLTKDLGTSHSLNF